MSTLTANEANVEKLDLTLERNVRIVRARENQDGYVMRDLETDKIGFIVNASAQTWQDIEPGQLWSALPVTWGERYFKAELIELIKD